MEALRTALLAALGLDVDLVKEAERKKDELLAQTEKDVVTRRAELSHELEAEEYRLKKAQEQTAAFVEKVRALHMQEAEYLAQLEGLCPPDARPAPDPVQEKADEIDDNVQRLLAQAMEAATAENLRSRAAEEADRDLSDTAEFPPGQPIEEDEGFPPDDEEDYQDEDDDRRPPMGSRINFGELQFGQDYEIT